MFFSKEYQLVGSTRTWFVAILFSATGIICGWLIPYLLTPINIPNAQQTVGNVSSIEKDGDMSRPVFSFIDSQGISHEFASGIWSNKQTYQQNEKIEIIFEPTNPENARLKDNKDLNAALLILRLLGGVFGLIGIAIIAMKAKGMDNESISRIGGLIGALSYAIPATFALPGLWYFFLKRPNMFFTTESTFGQLEWSLGLLFSITGILTFIGSIALYRYQKNSGKKGWFWSWKN